MAFLRPRGGCKECRRCVQVAYAMHPESKRRYGSSYDGSTVRSQLEAMLKAIYSPDYVTECLRLEPDIRYNNSLFWFNRMTDYLTIVKSVRTTLTEETVAFLDQLVNVKLLRQVG